MILVLAVTPRMMTMRPMMTLKLCAYVDFTCVPCLVYEYNTFLILIVQNIGAEFVGEREDDEDDFNHA